jgi:hypothetical protein
MSNGLGLDGKEQIADSIEQTAGSTQQTAVSTQQTSVDERCPASRGLGLHEILQVRVAPVPWGIALV